MFSWLENTPVALWVAESSWGYPFLLCLHVIGLAIVVGIFSMREMRLLGMFRALDPAAFLPLSKFGWAGFVVNAISGTLLFTSQAVLFVNNIAFLIKISCIAVGMILAGIIQTRLRGELTGAGSDPSIRQSTKIIAALSLLFWLMAITTGRLIAYI